MVFLIQESFFQSEIGENSPKVNIQNKYLKNYQDNMTIQNRRESIIDLGENAENFTVIPIRKNNFKKCTCNLHQFSLRRVDTISGNIDQAVSQEGEMLCQINNYNPSFKNFKPNEMKPSKFIGSIKNENFFRVNLVKLIKYYLNINLE